MPTEVKPADLQFAVKPSGVSTHRPSPSHLGFVEWLQENQQSDLKVCHRLDKETSGVMVFAKTTEAAQQLTQLFTDRQVEKEYYLVSPHKSKWEQWVVVEDKAKGTLVKECPWPNEEGDHILSLTKFQRISGEGSLFLYKAWPHTGKTHQIRKHATHCKIPLLGDVQYGGAPFPRLMLHCHRLKFQWPGQTMESRAELPYLFENLGACQDLQMARWITSLDRRRVLYPEAFHSDQSLRILHTETGDLRGDQVGEKVILGWWKSEPPSAQEEKKIAELMKIFGYQDWVFQWRPGAQSEKSTALLLKSSQRVLADWTFKENAATYQASLDRGQNFGLFLDQRERRQWLRDNSANLSVLNLFAFTGGFSLNAALGGARLVVTVDLFGKYLEWGKENFVLNSLNPEDEKFHWRRMDALDYLRFASKKNLQFDRIVCDPPSFSRSKKSKKVFRVERDYPEFLKLCLDCLGPKGVLLFSTNYEKWNLGQWQKKLEKTAEELSIGAIRTSRSQWDYEWQNIEANLKAFFLFRA